MTDIRWWDTTWGQLLPGDLVLANDATVWRCGISISYEGYISHGMTRTDGYSLAAHKRVYDPVRAARPQRLPVSPERVAEVVGLFALHLGAVEVPASAEVQAPEPLVWAKCGRTGDCVCRR